MNRRERMINELVYSAAGRFSACETQRDFDDQTRLYSQLLSERIDDLIIAAQPSDRLIAAAPDLLAACEAVVTDEKEDPCWYDRHGLCQAHGLQPKGECYMELARAAIAKARGDA